MRVRLRERERVQRERELKRERERELFTVAILAYGGVAGTVLSITLRTDQRREWLHR